MPDPSDPVAGIWLTYADGIADGLGNKGAVLLTSVRIYLTILIVPILLVIGAAVISGTFRPFLYTQF